MPQVGAVIVGIGAYRSGLPGALPPLRFASADADGIETYVRTCWPRSGDAIIERVKEEEATAGAIEEAFRRLGRSGPFELQVVFFSGHGLVAPDSTGVVVQPAAAGGPHGLLTPSVLDELLGLASATRTILILDCCFAEGIVGQMPRFSHLGGDLARLYVASSRQDQRTWEDDGAGHGVFTAHLLDLLNTGSSTKLNGIRDKLDVDGELFPVLCDQVPLYVLGQKQARQEPVKGGVSMGPVTLPVARAVRRIREHTPLQTALLRTRQIGGGLVTAAVALLLFAYTMLYYIEPERSGTLVVKAGTRWLEPVFRLLPTMRVDTGIMASELSSKTASSYPLQTGYSTGIWTHLTTQGYRLWYDAVSAGLASTVAARYNILVGVAGPTPVSAFSDETRPADVEFAAWAAMVTERAQDFPSILARIPGAERLVSPAISAFNPNLLDFQILDRTVADMENFADALALAAALDPVHTLPAYIGFLKATQEWLTHNTDSARGRNARQRVASAVADLVGVIARARVDRGIPALDPSTLEQLDQLSAAGYSQVVDAALSRVSGSAQVFGPAEKALASYSGDADDPLQEAALEAITAALDGSARAQALEPVCI